MKHFLNPKKDIFFKLEYYCWDLVVVYEMILIVFKVAVNKLTYIVYENKCPIIKYKYDI